MIALDRDGALWIARLDRPDKANALTRDMLRDLLAVVEQAREGPRALILTGTGKVFSAGADLDEARAGLTRDAVWEQLSGALAALPCLTIAALNGPVAGGAFGMVLACDLRIAAPSARFFYPVMRLGFLPQPSDPARLAALVGPARAKLLLMGGARLDAAQALACGLVDVVSDDPLTAARATAADALAASDAHVRAIKTMCEGRDPG